MIPTEFLMTVWPCRRGYVFVGAKTSSGDWIEKSLPPSGRERRLRDFLAEHIERHDVYFCPTVFSEPRRKRELALPTRWLHCDIDEGDVDAFEPQPSVLWQTSPGRTQALWRTDRRISVDNAEDFNHAFAQLGDAGGWSITKYLRIPSSTNFKPHYKRPRVELLRVDWTPMRARPVRLDDRPSRRGLAHVGDAFVNVDPDKHDPDEVCERYKILGSRTYRRTAGNRSKALCWLFFRLSNAGASADEIASVMWNAKAASKYKEKRGLLDLQKDMERLGKRA